MTLSIADRVSKTGKIKILPVVGKDPESKKTELIKVGISIVFMFCSYTNKY